MHWLDDERERHFDLDRLESGDPVQVWFGPESGWVAGRFVVASDGESWVELGTHGRIPLDEAVVIGLKRLLH